MYSCTHVHSRAWQYHKNGVVPSANLSKSGVPGTIDTLPFVTGSADEAPELQKYPAEQFPSGIILPVPSQYFPGRHGSQLGLDSPGSRVLTRSP